MKRLRPIALCSAVLVLGLCIHPSGAEQEPAEGDEAATAETEQDRQRVLESDRWIKARSDLDKWLSVQTVYTEDHVLAIESEMRNRIDMMTADELQTFLEEMEEKLTILLSPETRDARKWINRYFTDNAKQQMVEKYGIEDPLKLSAAEIEAAISEFYADRQSRLADKEALDRVRGIQNQAARQYRATRKAASEQVSRPARFGPSQASTSYAPRRQSTPQVYRAPYPKMGYSIGPWGGVWLRR